MDQNEIKHYELLGNTMLKALESRGFEAYYCANKEEALAKALEMIPESDVVSWGGSITIDQIGLKKAIIARNKVINRELAKSPEEKIEIMRQALLCDTFLMSSNAITEDGQLVNIDGNGNRCAALIYGPKQVVVIVGMNKVTQDVDSAIKRIHTVAAPINGHKFDNLQTPCVKTGKCMNCNMSDTMCCQIVITRRSRQINRIKVILVGESLGY